jgi:FkbM family methyltransferase
MMSPEQLKQFYQPLVRPGDLCFDVGANVGRMTRAMLELGAHVVAVEPLKDLCGQMRAEFSQEIKARRCFVVQAGCASFDGTGKIRVASDATKSMSTMSPTFLRVSADNGDPWGVEEEDIELVRLDHLVAMFGVPNYVKIDVEGMDADVLQELSAPVDTVSFEYNTQPGLIDVAIACVDRIAALGDYVFSRVPEGGSSFDLEAVDADAIKAELMAQHKSGRHWFGDVFARLRNGRQKNCPICATGTEKQQRGSPYYVCSGCGLWFQHPLPPKVYHGPEEPGVKEIVAGEMEANRAVARWLFDSHLGGKPARTLDIGSKIPMLARALHDLGCDAHGFDAVASPDNLGVPMHLGDFESIDLNALPGPFDLVTLVHTFEHFYQPAEAMRRLRTIVSDTGRVFIRLPDNQVPGWERDISPHHFAIHGFYHTLSSIAELCARTNTFVIEFQNALPPGQRDLVLRPIHA